MKDCTDELSCECVRMPGIPTYSFENVDYFGCPLKQVEPWCATYLSLYSHYKNGILWRGGGLADQPYQYIRIMECIESELHKIDEATRPRTYTGTPGAGGARADRKAWGM